jgi:hypothetical protein
MAVQDAYTPEEWKAVIDAPVMAGMLITFADVSGPGGLFQESSALMKALGDPGGTSSDLVTVIAGSWRGKKPDTPDVPKNRDQAKSALLNGVKRGTDLVAEKSPADADAYKAWLMTVARTVANAAKEGTLLGFGGKTQSAGEVAALDELATTLGVSAS